MKYVLNLSFITWTLLWFVCLILVISFFLLILLEIYEVP